MANVTDYNAQDAAAAEKRKAAGGGPAPAQAFGTPQSINGPVLGPNSTTLTGPQAYDPTTGTAGHVPQTYTMGNGQPPGGPALPPPGTPFDAAPPGGPALPPPPPNRPADIPGVLTWVPTADGKGWVPSNNPGAGQPAAPAAPAAGPAAGPAAPAPPSGAAPAPTSPATGPDQSTAYKDALMKLLNDGGKTASLEDPALKAQSDAYAVGQTRSTEQARSQAAERLASQGLSSSGALDQAIAGGLEQQGANQAGFNASLVGDAAKQNLQKLQTALSMMGNDINSAEGRALQKQIADTQAQIQREQMTQQGSQFNTDADLRRLGITTQADLGRGDLSLRDKLGSGGLNLGLLQALIGNQNFNSGLGADLGKFNAGLNQNAILQLLGGL